MVPGELLWVGAAGGVRLGDGVELQHAAQAPEVLVAGDRYTVIRERETFDQMLAG